MARPLPAETIVIETEPGTYVVARLLVVELRHPDPARLDYAIDPPGAEDAQALARAIATGKHCRDRTEIAWVEACLRHYAAGA